MQGRITTRAEINIDALHHNYRTVCDYVHPAEVSFVVKGNAYGHGAVMTVRAVREVGCRRFWVAHLDEGIQLRQAGIDDCDIHVLGGLTPGQLKVALEYDLIPFIPDVDRVSAYDGLAAAAGKVGRFHLKVDSGMGRLGLFSDDIQRFCDEYERCDNIRLEGAGTHVAAPKNPNPLNELQIRRFTEAVTKLRRRLPEEDITAHMAASVPLVRFRQMHLDMVRPGSLIYGLCHLAEHPLDLKPALSLKTSVVQVKQVPAGWNVGYGDNTAPTPRTLALLPMGQVDGMTPTHGRKKNAEVLIGGRRCPVVSIAADQMIADVTGLQGVEVGDEAVVIGRQKTEEITARQLGLQAGSSYGEILMKMSHRVPRLYYSDGKLVGTESLLGRTCTGRE